MSIVRAPRQDKGFTIVRDAVARDTRLSYRARGVLIAILSRPDGWRTDAATLSAEGKEGREAIRAALRELEECGYLVRERRRADRGRWVTETVVHDVPTVVRHVSEADASAQVTDITAGRTDDGFPGVGNPSPVEDKTAGRADAQKTGVGGPGVGRPGVGGLGAVVRTNVKTSLSPAPQGEETDADFAAWYASYPRREARGAAVKAYRTARKKATADQLLEGARAYAATVAGKERRYIAQPATWLNGERWLDEQAVVPGTEDPDAYRGWGSYLGAIGGE